MLKRIALDVLQLVYPNICLGCGERLINTEQTICFSCIQSLPYTQESITNNTLFEKLGSLAPISGVYALCYYNPNGVLQELMKELKYRKQPQIGFTLGTILGEALFKQSLKIDEIVPVPLHPKSQRKRGYNQAKKIAEGVANELQCPVNEALLLRTKNTKSQTLRGKLDRFENVENIFSLQKEIELNNKTILLIDDVITTGATMLSCAQALFKHNAKSVYLASLAKADALG